MNKISENKYIKNISCDTCEHRKNNSIHCKNCDIYANYKFDVKNLKNIKIYTIIELKQKIKEYFDDSDFYVFDQSFNDERENIDLSIEGDLNQDDIKLLELVSTKFGIKYKIYIADYEDQFISVTFDLK